MELIQAILYSSKYIFGRSGNTDLFYLFSAFALAFYLIKRHDKFLYILKASIPFAIVCAAMAVFYPGIVPVRCLVFFGKMLLNITLVVFVTYNSRKWKIIRFIEAVVWIHAIETIVALLLPQSSLWMTEKMVEGGDVVSRLRLFYMDAGSMAFSCGLILVLLVYQLITEEVIWRQIICSIVMVVDLFLSYGMGGIGCSLLAIVAMLLLAAAQRKEGHLVKRNTKKYVIGAGVSLALALGALLLNSVYSGRFKAIIHGTDSILFTRLIYPLANIGNVLKKTHFLGVGFGNANTSYALSIINANKAYPNSFLRIVSEGGIFGIILVLLVVIGLIVYCIKYGNIIDKALCIYIIVFQMISGYFTDSTNFFIYGWIMGDCLYNKIQMTGKCKIKIFTSEAKESLKVAMIGHKRIPSREGGVEIVVEELSKRLVKKGHNVVAYNRSGQHVSGAEFNVVDYDSLKEYEGIKIVKVATIQKKGIAAMIYSFIASIYVVCSNYDVVHYHAEGPCAFIWIPSLFGIRTVATIHGLDWQRNGKWGSAASAFIKFGEKMAVEFADEIIVLSRHVQQYFLDSYNRQTVLIPNGVNRPEKVPANVISDKWGLNGEDYILTLSRLTREKCTDLLISAYKKVKTDKKLVIAGGSSDSSEYVEMLHELAKDDDRIIFTGFVQGTEMEELYSNAYVYCLPSELEGMPLSLLEAMSFGNCCLTSDIPECTDVVRKKGVSFRTHDEEDLVQVLQELVDNQEDVHIYKSESADYICRKYNWNDVVDKTICLYKGLEIKNK